MNALPHKEQRQATAQNLCLQPQAVKCWTFKHIALVLCVPSSAWNKQALRLIRPLKEQKETSSVVCNEMHFLLDL